MPPTDRNSRGRLRTRLGAVVTSMAIAVGLMGLTPSLAQAAEPPAIPTTVTADVLPTWQVDGVVWSQTMVGNTVYVTGSFSKARPPGVAIGGAGEVDAQNIFAFDVRTGNPVPFAHSLNAQGLVIRANPDGSRIYVGGDFTAVDGQPRSHIAVFDTATGQLVDFNARTEGQVRGFAFSGSTVYVGGNFRSANGQPRALLAAFETAGGGQLLSWAPTVDDGYVWSMVGSPNGSRIIVGGSFTTLSGTSAYGMGAVNAATGAIEPWAANTRIRTAGKDGAITSLNTDGSQIYGTGYAFGAGAQFEGTFAADPATGAINWVNDCTGDTYDIFAVGQVAYSVSHAHDCSVVGGFGDTSPRSRWQKALAHPTFPTGMTTRKNPYGWDHTGLPYSGLAHWYPDLEYGTYTSSRQAAWTVTGNADYVVLGGEFPKVNGVNQQGLVRFVRRPAGPHAMKPLNNATYTPAPYSTEAGKVRVVFGSVWDRDDATITYDVYRSPGTRIATLTRNDSEFWKLPTMSITDAGAAVGSSVRYQVRATDGDGNVQWSAWSPYITVSNAAPSPYANAVKASGATHLWRLGEPSGTTLLDEVGDVHATASGVTLGTAGAVSGNSGATTVATSRITTGNPAAADPAVSVEAWVKTTSTRGGRIVGFGDASTGGTSTVDMTDRVLYLDNSGRVNFAVHEGGYKSVYSRYAVNDGNWHHLVGTIDGGGMQLFVDGQRVGRDQNVTNPKAYNGFWRIGSDQTTSLPNRPSDGAVAGVVDEVATYDKALSKADIQAHYTASGRAGGWGNAPADAYGAEVAGDQPDLFWRLAEASGAATDSSTNGAIGNVSGTVTRNQTGALTGNAAATFNGTSGLVVANQWWTAPRTYSAELWFKTASTAGGKLVGFGNTTTGLSASYDRHVTMQSNGKLSFGVSNGGQVSLVTANAYNNNQWHHLVATQGPEGMRLWVDAQLVGSNSTAAAANYLGHWRVGGDRTWGGTSSNYINGTLDEVAIYPRALTEQDVRDHYTAAGRSPSNRPPVAAFTTVVDDLEVAVDGSTSTDPDAAIPSYAWDFGDGTTGTGKIASHTYATAGTYVIRLTVTDTPGLSHSITKSVTVVANRAPVAAFTSEIQHLGASFDAAGSTDADGTLASYAWKFGDGQTGTGKTATHSYEQAGTYSVELTVTDDDGATHTATQDVTVTQPPNQVPEAAFTSETDEREVSFDASGSADPDGTISSYAWDFGDGETGTGEAAVHTYDENGTYDVELTVTDNRGGTDTVTRAVTVAANVAPGAAFEADVDDLKADLDASASDDPDGSIATYEWDFGDGENGTGETASHTYSEAGTYTVELTVTDNQGATDTVSHDVIVTAPTVWARDDFARSATGGWGAADRGGNWTIPTGSSRYSVSDGVGKISLTAGAGTTALLSQVTASDTDMRLAVTMDKAATGGGQYVSVIPRSVSGAGDYRAKVRFLAGGSLSVTLVKVIGSTETPLASGTLPGTYQPGEKLKLRVQAVGTGWTSLKVKAWTSADEPGAWTVSTTDDTAALQQAGTVGVYGYLSGSTSNGPVIVAIDDLRAGKS